VFSTSNQRVSLWNHRSLWSQIHVNRWWKRAAVRVMNDPIWAPCLSLTRVEIVFTQKFDHILSVFRRLYTHHAFVLVVEHGGSIDTFVRPTLSSSPRSRRAITATVRCRVFESALRHRLQSQRLSRFYNLLPA
jgi:hypothetical protein